MDQNKIQFLAPNNCLFFILERQFGLWVHSIKMIRTKQYYSCKELGKEVFKIRQLNFVFVHLALQNGNSYYFTQRCFLDTFVVYSSRRAWNEWWACKRLHVVRLWLTLKNRSVRKPSNSGRPCPAQGATLCYVFCWKFLFGFSRNFPKSNK